MKMISKRVKVIVTMQVIIDGFGTSLRKTSERLIVRDKDKKIVQEVPFFDVDDISSSPEA
jgi:hypothetical protein